jgi:hypothetical protein
MKMTVAGLLNLALVTAIRRALLPPVLGVFWSWTVAQHRPVVTVAGDSELFTSCWFSAVRPLVKRGGYLRVQCHVMT